MYEPSCMMIGIPKYDPCPPGAHIAKCSQLAVLTCLLNVKFKGNYSIYIVA